MYGIREPHQSMAKKKEITQEDVEIMWKKRQDELECRRDQQRERREKQREANKMVERRALADVVTEMVWDQVREGIRATVEQQVTYQRAVMTPLPEERGKGALRSSSRELIKRISRMLMWRIVLLVLWPFKILLGSIDAIIIFMAWAMITGMIIIVYRFLGIM